MTKTPTIPPIIMCIRIRSRRKKTFLAQQILTFKRFSETESPLTDRQAMGGAREQSEGEKGYLLDKSTPIEGLQ